MSIPSFENTWRDGRQVKPRIQLLEVRDKSQPAGKVLAVLLVERTEVIRVDPHDKATVLHATIRLDYQRLDGGRHGGPGGPGPYRGSFDGYYDNFLGRDATVSLTGGTVFLDLKGLEGQRIGTYLMNEIVTWVQQWPEAGVNQVRLLPGQATSAQERERRNRFYERFGLEFDYEDPAHRAGVSRPIQVRQLRNVLSWQANIRACQVPMDLWLQEKDSLERDLAFTRRELEWARADLRKVYAHPVRWALRVLWQRFREHLLGWGLAAMIALLVWRFFAR